ncbi:hypothetical protein, partial [Klebsiella pneumoniae]|uniref:hypothetical protein n=1 Tax=Klebsiella pneumoniae TaxID=573 RepID=UPI003012A16D
MPQALTRARIAQFVADGYVRIDNAFSTAVAAAARGIPWRETGWHIDVSFGLESPDFLDWRANVVSRGR